MIPVTLEWLFVPATKGLLLFSKMNFWDRVVRAGRGSEGRRGGCRILSQTSAESQGHNPAMSGIHLGQEEQRESKYEEGQQDEGSSKSFDHTPHFIHDCFSTLPFSRPKKLKTVFGNGEGASWEKNGLLVRREFTLNWLLPLLYQTLTSEHSHSTIVTIDVGQNETRSNKSEQKRKSC